MYNSLFNFINFYFLYFYFCFFIVILYSSMSVPSLVYYCSSNISYFKMLLSFIMFIFMCLLSFLSDFIMVYLLLSMLNIYFIYLYLNYFSVINNKVMVFIFLFEVLTMSVLPFFMILMEMKFIIISMVFKMSFLFFMYYTYFFVNYFNCFSSMFWFLYFKFVYFFIFLNYPIFVVLIINYLSVVLVFTVFVLFFSFFLDYNFNFFISFVIMVDTFSYVIFMFDYLILSIFYFFISSYYFYLFLNNLSFINSIEVLVFFGFPFDCYFLFKLFFLYVLFCCDVLSFFVFCFLFSVFYLFYFWSYFYCFFNFMIYELGVYSGLFPSGFGFSVNSYFIFIALCKLYMVSLFVFWFVFLFSCYSFIYYNVGKLVTQFYVSFVLFGYVFIFDWFCYFTVFFPVSCISGLLYYSANAMPFLDPFLETGLTVHIFSYQWGWDFVYYDFDFSYGSFPDILLKNVKDGVNPLVLPGNLPCLLTMGSLDVIHSFSVDSLGAKMDCMPGRLNSIVVCSEKNGLTFGNCAEFCGLNHSFMGFRVEFVSFIDYCFFESLC